MICTIGGSKMLAVRNIVIDCFINKRVKVGFKIKYCTNLFRPQQQQHIFGILLYFKEGSNNNGDKLQPIQQV